MHPIEEINVQERFVLKRTLWSELAEKFDENVVRTMPEPVVIALVALSVKQFRGNFFLL